MQTRLTTVLGAAAVIAAIYLFYVRDLLPAVLLLFIGVYLLFLDIRASVATRNISNITYNGFIDSGLARISRGGTVISKEKFVDCMSRIRDVVEGQQFLPEIGYDAVYLQYNSESGAKNDLDRIKQSGLTANLMQDKASWRIRIEP